MLPSDTFMSNLYSLLGYSTGELEALQIIAVAVLGAMDKQLASCMVGHSLEI